jgi:hypothetical protein
MHRLLELEIRLAYQELVVDTLPAEMADEDAPVLRLPEPAFDYASESAYEPLCGSEAHTLISTIL